MTGGSIARVRYVAEWVEELPPGSEPRLGERVACPHPAMVVRATAVVRLWRGSEHVGDELVVALSPHLVTPGSSWRVDWMSPIRGVRWPSGTVFNEGGDEYHCEVPSLDSLAEEAEAIARKGSATFQRASLSVLEPGEEGAGRALITLSSSEVGVVGTAEAIRLLAEEGARRYGEEASRKGKPRVPGARRVRFVTEWVCAPAGDEATLDEGDQISIPHRELVVRCQGSGRAGGLHVWVSADAEGLSAAAEHGFGIAAPFAPRGEDLQLVVGDGLVASGAGWRVHCTAQNGVMRGERHDDLDIECPTLDEALDAVVEWAEAVAEWAQALTGSERLGGSAELLAMEPGWDLGRGLAKAGTGGDEGLDALLTMLESFCSAAESGYGGNPLLRGSSGRA